MDEKLVAALERIANSLEKVETILANNQSKQVSRHSSQQVIAPKQVQCPIKDIWNKFADQRLSRVLEVIPNSTRDRNAAARWKEKPDDGYWTSVILRLNRSKFALGNGTKGWKADFDFLIKPETHIRILEGKYDDTEQVETKIVGYTAESGLPVWQTIKR